MPRPRKVPHNIPDGYISTENAMELLGMSLATFYRYKREYHDFPAPLMIGGKSYFKVDEIGDWKRRYMGDDNR